MVDIIYKYYNIAKKRGKELGIELGLKEREFLVVTVHRAENTNNPERLRSIIAAVEKLSKKFDIVFPLHPRTKNNLIHLNLFRPLKDVKIIEPLNYIDFLGLLSNCRIVLTDSGGVQEEAFTLKIPIVTLRYNTERPETTMYDLNKLAGVDAGSIESLSLEQINYSEKARELTFKNPLGDGFAGKRIAGILKQVSENGISIKEPDFRENPIVTYSLFEGEKMDKNIFEKVIRFTEDGEPIPYVKNCAKLLARIKKKNGKFFTILDSYPREFK